MRRLGSTDVLSAWEESRHRSSTHRALSILSRALPDSPPDELIGLPLGQRASLLLQQHCRETGATLEGVCTCPACAAQVSIAVDVAALTRCADRPQSAEDVEIDGRRFHIRPPNSGDLLAISDLESAAEARDLVLRRCVRAADEGESIEDWPVGELEKQIAARDPLAEIFLDAVCPDCDASWQMDFDVVEFVWEWLEERAQQLLLTIDALARAYGWSEPEILELSPARRAWYVDRVS